MTPNGTSWSFPPALNKTFVNTFNAEHDLSDKSAEDGMYSLLLTAVHNLTVEERVDSRFQDGGWGGEDAAVSVGDIINGTFTDRELRSYRMNCILCIRGRDTQGAYLGSIETACSNYTENPVYYTKMNGPASSLYMELPELDQYLSLTNQTCGLCVFSLPNMDNPTVFDDFSVPFPVLEQQALQPKVFNATNPTGITVSRPSSEAWPSLPPEPSSGNLKQGNRSNNTNLIIGVVVGVLAAASIFMGLIIWLWTRRKGRQNPYDSSIAVMSAPPASRDRAQRSVPLQHVQAVVRRPDSSAGEVPPAYHEVVRLKETEP